MMEVIKNMAVKDLTKYRSLSEVVKDRMCWREKESMNIFMPTCERIYKDGKKRAKKERQYIDTKKWMDKRGIKSIKTERFSMAIIEGRCGSVEVVVGRDGWESFMHHSHHYDLPAQFEREYGLDMSAGGFRSMVETAYAREVICPSDRAIGSMAE